MPQRAGPFLALCQAIPGLPDFLFGGDSATQFRQFPEELAAIAATPADLIRTDLDYYSVHHASPTVTRLRDHDQRELRRVIDGALALYNTCLAEDWPAIQRTLQADIAHRAQLITSQGTGALLHSLHPKLVLYRQTLLLAVHPAAPEEELTPTGRGLELRPNLFMEQGSVGGLLNDRVCPTVFYPATSASRPGPVRRDPLIALVGRGRAGALRAISDGATSTAGLARRLGVTSPTASEHAAALRNAGLITTRRDGLHVRHQLTTIGISLLAANRTSAGD